MDYEQCIVQVALYLDTHAQRCADFDGLENQNAPNRATCALDPPAAIALQQGTQSLARGTTATARVIAGEVRVYIATISISTHHMEPSFAIKQVVGYQRVHVWMKVEIFVEGMDRHDDGRNTVMRSCANPVRGAKRITLKITHALMRDARELLEQSAVKSNIRPQQLGNRVGNRECQMQMRRRRQDRLRQHRPEQLHLFSDGVTGRTSDLCRRTPTSIHGCTRPSAHA
jgi:hypothetical protein